MAFLEKTRVLLLLIAVSVATATTEGLECDKLLNAPNEQVAMLLVREYFTGVADKTQVKVDEE